jgi:hypothetical protein
MTRRQTSEPFDAKLAFRVKRAILASLISEFPAGRLDRDTANGTEQKMQASQGPACPHCARTDATLVSSRLVYRATDAQKEHPVAILKAFQCQCGLGFTQEEPYAAGQSRSATGTTTRFTGSALRAKSS